MGKHELDKMHSYNVLLQLQGYDAERLCGYMCKYIVTIGKSKQ